MAILFVLVSENLELCSSSVFSFWYANCILSVGRHPFIFYLCSYHSSWSTGKHCFATISRMKVCPSILEGRYLFLEKRTVFSSPLQDAGFGTHHTIYYVQTSLTLISSILWDLELWNWFKKRTLHCNSSSKTFVPKLQILCPLHRVQRVWWAHLLAWM